MTKKILEKPFPFEIPLLEGTLTCQRLLRTVANNRMVIAGEWKNKPVLAKFFLKSFPWGWLTFNREIKGAMALQAARMPTPAILYSQRLASSDYFIILYELLPNPIGFNQRIEKTTSQLERTAFFRELLQLIANQQNSGITQVDPHFKNFIYANEKLYSIDTSRIQIKKKPPNLKKSLRVLAFFLTEPLFIDNPFREEAIDWYLKLRGFTASPKILAEVHRQELVWKKKREERLRSKLYRTSTHFVSQSNLNLFWVCQRIFLSENLRTLLQSPEYLFSLPNIQIIKAGKTTTVALLSLDKHCFLIKRYNIKSFWHKVKLTLTKTRAQKSWSNAHRLQHRGIPTPIPVALIETYTGKFKSTNYFISEYFSGTTALEYFTSDPLYSLEKKKMANRVMDVLKKLTQEKICHRDLKASNIMINGSDLTLIDLDGMKFYRNPYIANNGSKKDMKRFMRNWEGKPIIQRLFAHE